MVQIKEADDRTRTDNLLITNQLLCQLSHIGINDPDGNRTRVTAVKGRCLNRLTMEPKKKKTPRVGLEPTTTRLTAECSTIELSRIIKKDYTFKTSYRLFTVSCWLLKNFSLDSATLRLARFATQIPV